MSVFKASRTGATKNDHQGHLEKIVVTAADGRVWDLGKPEHWLIGDRLFKWRRRRYLLSRRTEIEAQGGNIKELLHG